MGALSNIKVLDLSRILAGPFGTQILSDLGAEVWKIESPWGDDTRGWGPPFIGDESAYYLSANRGKKSLIVNLRDEEGQKIIKDLAKEADIFVENFKVGNLKRFGLDYESISAINPKIIYSSVTGFGQTGPRAPEPGYDAALQGMTGIMSVTGESDGNPTKVGASWIDIMTGLTSTIGILAALNERNISGKGQYIDVSLFDVGIACMANIAQSYLATGVAPGRIGNAHPQIVPYQDFTASDGNFMMAANNEDQFSRLCEVIGEADLPQNPKFQDNAARVKNRNELEKILNNQFIKFPKTHWIEVLQNAGLTVSPINTLKEVFEDEQAKARNSIWNLEHSSIGNIQVLGSALQHLSRTPAEPQGPPPLLGEHTVEIMKNVLKLDDKKIAELLANKSITGMVNED
ncbi:MAG: CoA transferase [SAR202 cluster bacterium]|nr:CoA transferase [SAR202 cluster bacterium]|tara:strand:+ start:34 stop:1242 length:1209 start_codon:yes stop_codon:yes gene_type:complete